MRTRFGLAVGLCATLGCNPSSGMGSSETEMEAETTAPPPDLPSSECGNGIVEPGEACDDGNELDEDGCDTSCNEVPELEVVDMSMQTSATCLLHSEGGVRCWGVAGHDVFGEYGLGNTGALSGDAPGPVARDVAVGRGYVFVVGTDGKLYGAGDPTGLLGGNGGVQHGGDGSSLAEAFEVQLDKPARDVECGQDHACVILEDGDVRCWGSNHQGMLGLGLVLQKHPGFDVDVGVLGRTEPLTNYPPVDLPGPVKQLALGRQHTCALLESGEVYCWGSSEVVDHQQPYQVLGEYGLLGYASPEAIGDDESPSAAGPVSLGGKAARIDAHEWRTCAVLESGDARCWGLGRHGYPAELVPGHVIGDDEVPSDMPPVNPDSRKIIDIGVAEGCIVMEDGAVRCTTSGGYAGGEPGYQPYGDLPDIEMGGAVVRMWGGLEAMGLATHVCAELDDKTLRCMGSNRSGALGYGPALPDPGKLEFTPAEMGPVPWKDAW